MMLKKFNIEEITKSGKETVIHFDFDPRSRAQQVSKQVTKQSKKTHKAKKAKVGKKGPLIAKSRSPSDSEVSDFETDFAKRLR
jgi:hypothetical protein